MLQRYLPFWLANLVDRMWPVLVTIIAVLIPLSRMLPPLYAVPHPLAHLPLVRAAARDREPRSASGRTTSCCASSTTIETPGRAGITVPLSYADELYSLRTHIHMVAERLVDPAPALRERGMSTTTRPRVLVIGCGFGGIEAVRALSKADGRDHARRPHQPPPVPAAALPGRDRRAERAGGQRADPPRAAPRDAARQPDDPEGEVHAHRRRRRERAPLDGGERIAWDHLIVAAGATHSYFGHDEWARARARA